MRLIDTVFSYGEYLYKQTYFYSNKMILQLRKYHSEKMHYSIIDLIVTGKVGLDSSKTDFAYDFPNEMPRDISLRS